MSVSRECTHVACGVVCALVLVAQTIHAQRSAPTVGAGEFPSELVEFTASPKNPVFRGEGPGHWDAKIRERGWILREGSEYHLWFTGQDDTRKGFCQLGYATSSDGYSWTRYQGNPLVRDHWVEDMMVVKHADTYYMFAEGLHDRAQLLTSKNHVDWVRRGTLDVRDTHGRPIPPGPFGTPTVWLENGTWNLFYERMDAGVWLATSKDLKVWTNVQDEPVLRPGPEEHEKAMIALNQIVKHGDAYFAYYHGSGGERPRTWNTNVARSTDLVHWKKYLKNPIVPGDRSSGIIVFDGQRNRLYTMHPVVDVFLSKGN